MGKHKEKSHKRKHEGSSSDDSEEEVRKHKDKKAKKHKKEKKSKKDDEEKQLLKAAKKFLKNKLKADEKHPDEGQPAEDNTPLSKDEDIEEITADDYFIKNAEFSEWLRLQQGLLFNDLTSEQARSHFVEFVEAWNARALPARYYKGVAGTTLRRTKHAWAIKGSGGADRTAVGLAAAMEEDRNAYSAQRAQDAAERKQWRGEQRDALDELLPKATAGREARIDQKMARREAAKEREASPEMTRLPGGGDVMGGDDSIAAARAREAKQNEWKARKNMVREEQMRHKLSAAQEAEEQKMAQFRALLAQGPITIARRAPAE